jgi:tungstate transport system substrate-binding protein
MKRENLLLYLVVLGVMLSAIVLAGCTTPPATNVTPTATAPSAKEQLLLATTTSLYDTGLLDYLKPMFEKQYNVDLLITSQGTGKALELAARGDADVLAVHSPSQEKDFVASGKGMNRRCFAYNYFIIVGPANDPAGIRGMDTTAAFKKIYQLGMNNTPGVVFVSRGDNSGTHTKEKDIWKAAGFNYTTQIQKSGPWYVEAGRGMGETLQLTNEKQAYTISDEGTYLAYKGQSSLVPMNTTGDILLNVYSVITVYNEKFSPQEISMANNFVDFMISNSTQTAIGVYGVDKYGKPLFTPMKGNCSQFNCTCTGPATQMTPVPA